MDTDGGAAINNRRKKKQQKELLSSLLLIKRNDRPGASFEEVASQDMTVRVLFFKGPPPNRTESPVHDLVPNN